MSTAECSRTLLALLRAYGVDSVFGIPGNHTVEFFRHQPGSGIRHITTRHEQGAAFMADGYARASGRPGVCLLISGPGLLNAATAIAQARADSVPMLVISAVAPRSELGMGHGTLHELPDQRAAAASFCLWSHTLLDPGNLPEVIHQAFTTFACTRPGPVHLEIPLDLMRAPGTTDTAARPLPLPPAPHPAAVAAAARLLERARQPLLLAGGGATAAAEPLLALAERLDAPVLNTVNGKGLCPPGHVQHVGGSPSLPSQRRALAAADAVLAVGTELAETDFDLLMSGPFEAGSGLIRLDIDPAQLGRNARAELSLAGDAAAGLQALLLDLGSPRGAAEPASGSRAAALRAQIPAEHHYHAQMAAFLDAVRQALPDAVLVGDSTQPTYYAAWQYECPAPRRYFHSVSGFGTLGYAIPAAFGAALAVDRPVMALIGDGGAQFTLAELSTGAALGLGVPVIVWRNDGYQEIANSMTGVGVDAASTRIQPPDFRHAAAAHGCGYQRVSDLPGLAAALTAAAAARTPTVIEARQEDFLSEPTGGWYT
ncbi:MAG: 5-guanidino-2-oxopentanoate decarboxylase [Gammaproteobacteria bacterium]|nr:5-guanidino-2-oxopentanoate decarboxylase [Gammaproteobacteria bacterium]